MWTMEAEALPGRDLFVVAKCLVPTDAYLLQGCLVAGGVPAVVADANHVQADLLIAPALGGVRILAPAALPREARTRPRRLRARRLRAGRRRRRRDH